MPPKALATSVVVANNPDWASVRSKVSAIAASPSGSTQKSQESNA